MNHFILSLIFFIIFVSLSLYFEMKHIDFTDSNSEEDCNSKHLLPPFKEGDKCGVWDGSQCRKDASNIISSTYLIDSIIEYLSSSL
jgi:hypothetical protein